MHREKLDADLARSIDQEGSNSNTISSPSIADASSSSISAFDRLSGVRPVPNTPSDTNRQSPKPTRKLPWHKSSVKSEHGSTPAWQEDRPSNQSQFGPASSNVSGHGVREENRSLKMPGNFDADSSDADDSDIEIIPSSAFRDNGRHPISLRPAQISGQANMSQFDPAASQDGLRHALYGNKPVPNWLNSGVNGEERRSKASHSLYSIPAYDAGESSMHGAGAGNYAYPNNSRMNEMYSMPGAYPGGTMQNLQDGRGYTINGLPNYGINQPGLAGMGDLQFLSMFNQSAAMNESPAFGSNQWNARMFDQAAHIVNDPRKTNQEIKELLENIRPDVDLPPEDREGTPDGLVYPLVR